MNMYIHSGQLSSETFPSKDSIKTHFGSIWVIFVYLAHNLTQVINRFYKKHLWDGICCVSEYWCRLHSKGCTGGQRNEFMDQMSACVHSNDMWFGLVVTSDQV